MLGPIDNTIIINHVPSISEQALASAQKSSEVCISHNDTTVFSCMQLVKTTLALKQVWVGIAPVER